MPIYEYRCGACGFQKEFLQRLNEKPLTVCPECGKRSFNKMVTAAGFQLKGTGWYATDFRGGAKSTASSEGSDGKSADAKSVDAKSDGKTADAKADKPAAKDSSKKKSESAAKKTSAASTSGSSS
ncbi:MAG TPA: FmdB family zinc ribbon protein [Burkholderiales bacterium]|nr:FmdB family zinc ribbon protein [Burkholderiales bacterium]